MLDVLIPAIHSHVQIVVVIQKPDLSVIRGRYTRPGPLGEVRRGNRLLPDGFLQMTIQRRRQVLDLGLACKMD